MFFSIPGVALRRGGRQAAASAESPGATFRPPSRSASPRVRRPRPGPGRRRAACDGIARNPGATAQIRGMAFLALVLIESLVIYALVIAFVVQGK